MFSLSVVNLNLLWLQKYFMKPCQLIARSNSTCLMISQQCKRCQRLQTKQLSSFSKKNANSRNTLCDMILPSALSSQHQATFFNQSVKDRLQKWGFIMPENFTQKQLDTAAQVLLNGIYMKVPFKTLREIAGLEDTFLMWMRIVYIHLWFLFCQFVGKGGRDGEILINSITNLLWNDLTERLKTIQNESDTLVKSRNVLKQAYADLYWFFLLLDEGLLKGDAELASSLWTLIYSLNSYDAEAWHMENLVHYIRYTVARMQEIQFKTFVLKHEAIEWTFPKEILDSIKEENRNWA